MGSSTSNGIQGALFRGAQYCCKDQLGRDKEILPGEEAAELTRLPLSLLLLPEHSQQAGPEQGVSGWISGSRGQKSGQGRE